MQASFKHYLTSCKLGRFTRCKNYLYFIKTTHLILLPQPLPLFQINWFTTEPNIKWVAENVVSEVAGPI